MIFLINSSIFLFVLFAGLNLEWRLFTSFLFPFRYCYCPGLTFYGGLTLYWETIKFPAKSKDCLKFQKCIPSVALNIYLINNSDENNIEMDQTYISEQNSIRKKNVALLNCNKTISINCLNFLHFFRTE